MKVCPHCNSEFEPGHHATVYCSPRCRRQFGNLIWNKVHPYPQENHAWRDMRRRCNNPKHADYPLYGARGVKVCERWQKFDNFIADMGPRPGKGYSIDRINNNGDYEPGNCKWATATEQSRNRRPASEWRKPSRSHAPQEQS